MRGAASAAASGTGHSGRLSSSAPRTSQGLTLGLKYKQMNLKLKAQSQSQSPSPRLREVSERKQVGDAESMVNEGLSEGSPLSHGYMQDEETQI